MKLHQIATAFLIASSLPVSAQDRDAATILAEGRKIQQTDVKAIRTGMSAALKKVSGDIQDQVQLVNGLRLAEQQPRIIRKQEIDRLRRRLAVLEQLETYVDSDEAQREAQKSTADDRLKELQAKQQETLKPAQEKLREISRKYKDEHRELAEAMSRYFAEVGPDPFGELKRQRVSAQFQECTVSVHYGTDDKKTLQVSTSYEPSSAMRGLPIEQLGEGITLLAAKKKFVTVRAGSFRVQAIGIGDGWKQDRLKQVVVALVDLEGLSKLQVK